MRIPFILICMALLCNGLIGQLQVEHSSSVEDYVLDQLLGPGVSVENIHFNGASAINLSSQQCGYFNSSESNVGLDHGLIISNGYISGAIGPNDSEGHSSPVNGMNLPGDPDLDQLTIPQTHDAAVLEFDFTPDGDTLIFEYVFASEEYPEFANGVYNDVFGFFISGPGFSGDFSSPSAFPLGAQNLAYLPGTDIPISINTVNNGNENIGPCEQCEYLLSNGNGLSAPQNSDASVIQYDGVMVPITIKVPVTCGESYHIKLAIADAGDDRFDSAIFFKSGSFQTNASYEARIEVDPQWGLPADLFYENCFPGTIHIERSPFWTHEETLSINYGGNSQAGDDFTSLPSEITFDQSTTSFSFPFTALYDELSEGIENVDIEFTQNLCGTDVSELLSIQISDPPEELAVTLDHPPAECGGLLPVTLNVEGGLGYYSYLWEDGQQGDSAAFILDEDLYTTVIIQDLCVAPVVFPVQVDVSAEVALELSMPEDIVLDCGDDLLFVEPTVSGGHGELGYEWFLNGQSASTATSWNQEVLDDGVLQLIIHDDCGGSISASTDFSYSPYTPPSVHITSSGAVCLGEETYLGSELSGGLGPYSYHWSEGASQAPELDFVGTGPTLVSLTVVDACGEEAEDEVYLEASQTNSEFLLQEEPGFQFFSLNLSSNNLGSDLAYSWFVDEMPVSTLAELNSEFFHEDEHEVLLIVQDEFNCSDEYRLTIQPEADLYVPSAFSPGAEDALNARFEVKGKAIAQYQIEIFDRKGQVLYTSENMDESWDGSHPEASTSGHQTYFYSISALGKSGEQLQTKGSITVLR